MISRERFVSFIYQTPADCSCTRHVQCATAHSENKLDSSVSDVCGGVDIWICGYLHACDIYIYMWVAVCAYMHAWIY